LQVYLTGADRILLSLVLFSLYEKIQDYLRAMHYCLEDLGNLGSENRIGLN